MAESVNKQLQQMMITHQVYIEKYKTFEENKMLKILEGADEELKALLESKYKPGLTKSRQEQLYEAIKALEESYGAVFTDEMKSDLKIFAGNEGGWTVDQLRKVTNSYLTIDFIVPSAAQIYAAAEASFLILQDGVTLDLESIIQSVFGNTRATVIEQSLRQGYILGKTTDQMVKELLGSEALNYFDGNLRKARTSMERIVRTSFSHMSGVARDEVYSKNDDLVKGYKWVSTLDSRVSPFCISMDGKCWYYDKENVPSGVSLMPHQIKPPGHYGCRSTTVPIIKSWKELGINISEAPEGTRSSLDGYVPASTTYAEWFDKAGADVQKEVLGAERFKMYQAGEMKVTQFMKDGSWLSLEQLKQRGH
jgi:SPP1 gp7 family putative phage head morphogenesis protein